MNEKDLKFLEYMEKELAPLSQYEFYELLTDWVLKRLTKLDTGEGRIILTNNQ